MRTHLTAIAGSLVLLVACDASSPSGGVDDTGAGGLGGSGENGGSGGSGGSTFVPCEATQLPRGAPMWWNLVRAPDGWAGLADSWETGAEGEHLWTVNEELEMRDLGLVGAPASGFWSLVPWDSRWAVVGEEDVVVADLDGQVLATRHFASLTPFTGVKGAVPTPDGLVVLWADDDRDVHVELLDPWLRTLGSAGVYSTPGVEARLDRSGSEAFVAWTWAHGTGPVHLTRVASDLSLDDAVELEMSGTELRAWPRADADGNVLAAVQEEGGIRLHRFELDGTPTGSVLLAEGTEWLNLDVHDGEIVAWQDRPLGSIDVPILVWAIAGDLSSVEGPFHLGSGVVAPMVERRGDHFRALAYRDGQSCPYCEFWLFEGTDCR